MAYESYPVEASSWFNPAGMLPNKRNRVHIPTSSNIIIKFLSEILRVLLNSLKQRGSFLSLILSFSKKTFFVFLKKNAYIIEIEHIITAKIKEIDISAKF